MESELHQRAATQMRSARWRIPFAIAAVLPAVLLLAANFVSCSSTQSARIAQEGTSQFRSSMESGEFEKIYREADDALRAKHAEEDFVRLLGSFGRSLGPVQSAQLRRARESLFSRKKYVTLHYRTQWAKEDGEEKFVFLIRDGRAILDSYVISTPGYPPAAGF